MTAGTPEPVQQPSTVAAPAVSYRSTTATVGPRKPRQFLGHRGEDLLRGGGPGRERRDPPQRHLVAGEPLDLFLRDALRA